MFPVDRCRRVASRSVGALDQNLNMFYPRKMLFRDGPLETNIRAGGMVEEGSLVRDEDSLELSFVLSDRRVQISGCISYSFCRICFAKGRHIG